MGSYKKKLFIVLLLISLLGFFVCGSVNATTYYQTNDAYKVDPEQYVKNMQENLAKVFIYKLDTYCSSSEINSFKNYINENYFTYFLWSYNSSDTSINTITCYFIPSSVNFAQLSSSTINTNIIPYNNAYETIPVTGYNIPTGKGVILFRINLKDNTLILNNYSATSNTFVPTFLIFNQNNTLNNYKNGISPSDNIYAMLFQAIDNNTEATNEVADELKETNKFLKSDDVDNDAYNMPTDNPTEDITQTGIDNIFNKFYNKITSWESENIRINIPFTNKYFIIPANLTENIITSLSSSGFSGILKQLLGLVWYYLLGVYIVKDVQKYIDGLKTGEILTKSDTNIKTEML